MQLQNLSQFVTLIPLYAQYKVTILCRVHGDNLGIYVEMLYYNSGTTFERRMRNIFSRIDAQVREQSVIITA